MTLRAQLAHELRRPCIEEEPLTVDVCVLFESGKYTVFPLRLGKIQRKKDTGQIVAKNWLTFVEFRGCVVDLIRIHLNMILRPFFLYINKDLRFGPCIPLDQALYDYFKTDITPANGKQFTIIATCISSGPRIEPHLRHLPIDIAKEAMS